MARASTITKLPADVRELIGRLREQGRTIDEILGKLRELEVEVSRSALGRHVKQLDAIGAEIRRSRAIAEAIVAKYGEAGESKVARLNIELMHGLIMKLLVGEEGRPVQLDGKEAMFIGMALQKLSAAAKQDVEREVKIRRELMAKLVERLDGVVEDAARAGEKGLSAERIAQLRREFLGVAA